MKPRLQKAGGVFYHTGDFVFCMIKNAPQGLHCSEKSDVDYSNTAVGGESCEAGFFLAPTQKKLCKWISHNIKSTVGRDQTKHPVSPEYCLLVISTN